MQELERKNPQPQPRHIHAHNTIPTKNSTQTQTTTTRSRRHYEAWRNNMIDDRYLEALKELTKDTETNNIPDRVKKYTHDINGKKLPCEYIQLNEQYVHHLNKIPLHIQSKNDYFALCFGYPGAGKTRHLIKTCLYLNADFGIKDISFTIDQLEEWIRDAPRGSIGLFDEADAIAGGYYDLVLQSLIRNMQRIRTKGLILFFCTPTMRDMHHYFAFRAKMVIYCYVPKNTAPDNRGWIHLWHDQDLIADLFARMKKAYSENSRVYNSAFSTLKNKYNGQQTPPDWHINEEAYEKKKEEGRRAIQKEGSLTPRQATIKERDKRIAKIDQLLRTNNLHVNQKDLAKAFDISPRYYREILGTMEET
jgi:hypothetical protein